MTMTELEALLAAIAAHPDDDTPRLGLADWLDDNADYGPDPDGWRARAEFIRVGCELARVKETQDQNCKRYSEQIRIRGHSEAHGYVDTKTMLPAPCSECWAALHRRERELLAANQGAWTDSLPESLITAECPSCQEQAPDWETGVVECRRCDGTGLVPNYESIEFYRGFLSRIHCSWSDCAAHLDSILADPWVPGLDEVELTTEPGAEWAGPYHDPQQSIRLLGDPEQKAFTVGQIHNERQRHNLPTGTVEPLLRLCWPKEQVRSWKLPPGRSDERCQS